MKDKAQMKNGKARYITLWIHSETEMAEIKEGRETLHSGNFWDFHAGCYGTVITFEDGSEIDFEHEWTDEIRRPWSVAEMIADKIGAEVITRERETPFNV